LGKGTPGFLTHFKTYLYEKQFIMSAVAATKHITEEEYLEAELTALERHEYYQGEVFAMSGGSVNHESIVGDSFFAIRSHLQKKACRVFGSNLRIQIEANGLFTYPDISIFCEQLKPYKTRKDTVVNPTILIEVLSPSTQNYDRGDKFSLYRDLPSLKEYVLISSTQVLVEHHVKQADDQWQLTIYRSRESIFTIHAIDFTTEIGTFYENINFEA
jgi:Uma2 family endonuclease